MTELGPLDFARMAALTMSGFGSSKDALDAVAEHVDRLCADIVRKHQTILDCVLSGREVKDLVGEERTRAVAAWSELRNVEQIKISVIRTLGVYAGLLFRSKPTEQEAETALFLLAKLADDLVQVGANYMVGKAETEMPQAVMTASDAGKLGAAASESFKKKQVESWQQRADPIILEVIKKHPSWSGDRIAQDVIALARERNVPVPNTTRTIAPYVRAVMARLKSSDSQ